jgi:AmmeMemoRadiSam system protein B
MQIDENEIISPLRTDINANLIEHEGNQFVLLQDPQGYAKEPIAISYAFYMLAQHFNGDTTYSEFEAILKEQGIQGDYSMIFSLIDTLDSNGYLLSKNYIERRNKLEAEYINSPYREPVCQGGSYPEDPEELKMFLNDFFDKYNKEDVSGDAKSIIVPHIDFRIGNDVHKTYASGYHSIRNTDADLFVIIGTSHYANSDFFMLTNKDFKSPLGTIETDKELINELQMHLGDDLTIDDFAHKQEHSVELQAVLLLHYFADRKFKILPILAGSLHKYILSEQNPEENNRYNNFIDALKRSINELGRKAVFISSVDFAHIGRKFGDNYDAEPILNDLKKEDDVLIDALNNSDKHQFLGKIREDKDKYKICGTAPIYAMLHTINPAEPKFLNYGQWNEKETKSAVSFASLAYYK